MRSAGKPTHIWPHFRQKNLSDAPFNARDRLQAQEDLLIGSEPFGNLGTQPGHGLL